MGCEAPAGWADNPADCDDAAPEVFPGAHEKCNGVDDDCDGAVSKRACTAPPGHVGTGGDCDDSEPAVHPAGLELCNEVDDDCDGLVDLYAADAATWYLDADGDGAGDPSHTEASCEAPPGFAPAGDDASASTYDNWSAGEPDDGAGDDGSAGEDCAEINLTTDGTWTDADCTELQWFVCEFE